MKHITLKLVVVFLSLIALTARGGAEESLQRLHIGDNQTQGMLETADRLADRQIQTTFVEVNSLKDSQNILKSASQPGGDGSYDQIAIQLFSPRQEIAPEKEAEQVAALLKPFLETHPEAQVLILQSWTDASAHYDEITASWDAYAWADRTLEAVNHQEKTFAKLQEQFGQHQLVLIPLGKAMVSVHGKLAELGNASPFYNTSEFIADYGMSPYPSRVGVALGALTVNHALGAENSVDLREAKISASHLDPKEGSLDYGSDAVEILRNLAKEANRLANQ